MTRLRRALLPAALALALAVVAPLTAHADSTLRYDDGTRETSVRMDRADGYDTAYVLFDFPAGTVHLATSATLSVYAQAVDCDFPGNGDDLVVNGYSIQNADPCATWPRTSYGWHSFDIPLEYFRNGINQISLVDHGGYITESANEWRIGSNADLAIDTSADVHSTVSQSDTPTVQHPIAGELMWYLTFAGTGQLIQLSTDSLTFPVQAVGTTSPAQTVTVTSDGNVAIDPTVSVTGDFAIANDTCAGQSVGAGSSCTFDVTFTPTSKGSTYGSADVSAPGAPSKTIALHGEAPTDPPHTTVATPDGATLVHEPVRGTVAGLSTLDYEWVTFRALDPWAATAGIRATLTCNATRTSCDWSAGDLLTPGHYAVTAYGADVQGNVEMAGPPITVTVI